MAATTSSSVIRKDLPSLPLEVFGCVLSFLPVPVLCRFRTVCKGWNDLVCSPSFHDLYEQNGKQHREVVFLTRFEDSLLYSRLDPDVKGKTCFLDLTERRWYVMDRSADEDVEARVVAMDEGLVVEFCCEEGTAVRLYADNPSVECLQIANPVNKSHLSWFLEPPFLECPRNEELPTLVVAADRASRSFRLFLMTDTGPDSQFMYSYQSSTYIEGDTSSSQERSWDHGHNWRCTKQPQLLWSSFPTALGTRARSAVFFRGALYAILSPSYSDYDCPLMRYNCEEDSWITIRKVFLEESTHPELMVTNDRLFMTVFRLSTSSTGTLTSEEEFSHTLHPLEIVEIQVPENASRTMFRIPAARLDHFFGEPFTGLACVVPCVSTIGSCTSAALISSSSGKVIIYNAVSGSAETLPSHPLSRANLNQSNPRTTRRRGTRVRYWATYKHLSFRDILREKHSSHPFDFEERPYVCDARA